MVGVSPASSLISARNLIIPSSRALKPVGLGKQLRDSGFVNRHSCATLIESADLTM